MFFNCVNFFLLGAFFKMGANMLLEYEKMFLIGSIYF